MTTVPPTIAEITHTAITLLCRELGPANTARFLNQFTPGFGDYTNERDHIVGDATVDELIEEIMQQRRKKP